MYFFYEAFMDLPYTEHILVNNVPAGREEKVYENFTVEWSLEAKTPVQEELHEVPEMGNNEDVIKNDTAEAATEKEEPSAAVTAPAQEEVITLIINGRPVALKGKPRYTFVDILDFYPFDISDTHIGQSVVMQINGERADFTSPVADKDVIDLYWK